MWAPLRIIHKRAITPLTLVSERHNNASVQSLVHFPENADSADIVCYHSSTAKTGLTAQPLINAERQLTASELTVKERLDRSGCASWAPQGRV